jgi:hypothetical protein
MLYRLRYVATAILLFALSVAAAQDGSTDWVRGVTGQARLVTRPEQAQEQARNNAFAEALERKGIRISNLNILEQSESANSGKELHDHYVRFMSVVQASTQGFVTAVENVNWKWISTPQADPSQPPFLDCVVTLDARISIPPGSRDPDFRVEPKLDKLVYRAGDSVHLQIKTTKPCYLHVFDITRDSVIMVVPSSIADTGMATPESPLIFPPPKFHWTASILADREEDEELLMVVGTRTDRTFNRGELRIEKDPREKTHGEDREANRVYVATRHAARMELMAWIATIPQSDLACSWETLRIVKNNIPEKGIQ